MCVACGGGGAGGVVNYQIMVLYILIYLILIYRYRSFTVPEYIYRVCSIQRVGIIYCISLDYRLGLVYLDYIRIIPYGIVLVAL